MGEGDRRGDPASQNRGPGAKNRGRKRRQGGKGRPFEKGQPNLPGKRFGAGQPGNPGGRPKSLKEVKQRIQERGDDLLEELFYLAFTRQKRKGRQLVGPSDDTRRLTIRDLMDRGYGRPVQAVEVSGPGGGALEHRDISQMTSAERRQRLRELLTKAGAGAGAVTAGEIAKASDDGEAEADGEDPDRP